MKYKYSVKVNGKWYAAGEDVPEATAIADVEDETDSIPETVEEDSPATETPEAEAVAEEKKPTGKRKTVKK